MHQTPRQITSKLKPYYTFNPILNALSSYFAYIKGTQQQTKAAARRVLLCNDSLLLAKVMALIKQSCCVAGRFSTNHLWLSPRCVPHVSTSTAPILFIYNKHSDGVAALLTAPVGCV